MPSPVNCRPSSAHTVQSPKALPPATSPKMPPTSRMARHNSAGVTVRWYIWAPRRMLSQSMATRTLWDRRLISSVPVSATWVDKLIRSRSEHFALRPAGNSSAATGGRSVAPSKDSGTTPRRRSPTFSLIARLTAARSAGITLTATAHLMPNPRRASLGRPGRRPQKTDRRLSPRTALP